eukprot:Em0013g258a
MRSYSSLGVKSYDALVVGGGHNGLVAAAYLAKAGKKVAVLERRHVLGGAAVTEEIIPGYKFSRASYLLSLLRPQIIKDLELKKHGLKVYHRNPSSYTPIRGSQLSLTLGRDEVQNCKQIAQFSRKDAEVGVGLTGETSCFIDIEMFVHRPSFFQSIEPLLDSAPINLHKLTSGSLQTRLSALKPLVSLTKTAKAAQLHGAELHTEKPVQQIIVKNNVVEGVLLQDGTVVRAKTVLSNATPKVTFFDLLSDKLCFDIPVALRGLPNFIASPNTPGDPRPGPHHQCTIHLNCEDTEGIHKAYLDCLQGNVSSRPLIEMCMPSSLDPTLAPEGCHVLSLFTQYTPYQPASGPWNDENKEKYCQKVFDCIEEYAPGFKQLVVGKEVLTPPDLERIFGLTGGSIFHGSMSLDQLYMFRPIPLNPGYATPIKGLYLCGSGTHPGGGVMGSPGRLAATAVLDGKLCDKQ